MYAIVEIHDVSPFCKQEVYQAVEFLQRLKIDKFSLLVIPNHMEEYPLYKHQDFVGFLKALGQEIVLHGYSHKAKVKLSDILYTYGEGEFGEGALKKPTKR
jgi:predicted deacetylase